MARRVSVLLLMAVWMGCVAADISDMSKSELHSLLKDVFWNEPESTSGPCEDTSLYQDCHRVVLDHLCTAGPHYAHYCCRSCLNAGQVDRFGPHMAKGVKAPLVAEVDREAVVVQRNDDVILTCSASGYPIPEVGWISPNGTVILHGTKYLIKVHRDDTPLVRTVQSTLTLRNFSYDDAGIYVCLAVTPHDHTTTTTTLTDPGRLQWVRRSRSHFVGIGEPMFLECVVKAACPPTIVWKFNGRTVDDDIKFRNSGSSSFILFVNSTGEDEEGLVTVYSSFRVNSSHTGYGGLYTCLARNPEATEYWTFLVSVKNVRYPYSNCTDVNQEECYKAVQHQHQSCYGEPYLARYCCRSCTLGSKLSYNGSHLQHVSKDMSPSLSLTGDGGHYSYLGTATIDCYVEGIPDGLILAWFKDTTILEHSPKYTIKEMPMDDPYFTRTLRLYVHKLTLADAGNYTCTATPPTSTPAASSVMLRFDSDATFNWKNI